MLMNQGENRLTIEDIETKQFRLVARGYEQREVDEFLDCICDEIELLQGEVDDMKRKLRMAEAENRKAEAAGGFVRPAASEGNTEESVREILEMAQRIKEQTIADAQAKADEILENARNEASARIGGLEDEKIRLENVITALKGTVSVMKEKISEQISLQQELLNRLTMEDEE